MDPAAIISLTAAGSGVAGYILKRIVDHLLGRGKIRVDEASAIRAELRAEIERKNKWIDALEQRIIAVESEQDKVERERNILDRQYAKYRVEVYRMLIESGVHQDLLARILALPVL